MRALVVVGMMLVAGAAGAAERNLDAAYGVVHAAVGAGHCGLTANPEIVDKALAEAGFSRAVEADRRDLDQAYATASLAWQAARIKPGERPADALKPECASLRQSYGRNGFLRPGLVKD